MLMCKGVKSENMCIMEWILSSLPRIKLPFAAWVRLQHHHRDGRLKTRTPDNKSAQINFQQNSCNQRTGDHVHYWCQHFIQDDSRRSKCTLHEHCACQSHCHGGTFPRDSWNFKHPMLKLLKLCFRQQEREINAVEKGVDLNGRLQRFDTFTLCPETPHLRENSWSDTVQHELHCSRLFTGVNTNG